LAAFEVITEVMDLDANPELIISVLRLLSDWYKIFGDVFRDRKTPEHVEEILLQLEKNPEKLDMAEIEGSLTRVLEPNDAAIVKADLERLLLWRIEWIGGLGYSK
jgi:predicted nucleotidyltransferase